MQGVRGQNVDCLDFGVLQQSVIVAGRAIDADALSELARFFVIRGGNRRDLHVAEAPDVFSVDFAHESSSDDGGLQFLHNENYPLCRYLE